MTKLEFMKELESLLSDIPLEEREEALQYYNGYFEDAGEDHEAEIIAELVSPARVAKIIKADLNSNAADRESRGYFTENGYQDTAYADDRYEIIGSAKKDNGNRQTNNTSYSQNTGNRNGYNARQEQSGYQNNNSTSQQYNSENQQRTRNTNTGLIILLIATSFIWFPIVMSLFGIVFGLVMAIIGIIFGFGTAGVVMIGAGFALFISGIVQIGVPLVGLLLCGSGLFVLGLGMMFIIACIMLSKKVLPALIRGTVGICRRPFQNRRVAA